ncbi:MAG: hypothetical protein CMK09_06335 [Ponticaulis sp.]|nr:hypothetical protein [Ponticaulis sp.]|tara:strand:- start:6318 stop:6734 length:417 start_codon:yes stop_codon:yes gene_type:complete
MKRIIGPALAFVLMTGSVSAEMAEPENDVDVIVPPRPEYPGTAAFFGLQGKCEVRFDLLQYGQFVDVKSVSCTNLVFCKSSSQAVRGTQFKVVDVPATSIPGERHNIVYPIAYNLDDRPRGEFGPFQTCPPEKPGLIG